MRTRVLAHLRRNAIAWLALLIALSGSAYAATNLKKNSVGPKQLKSKAVKTSKIADKAVTEAKLADGAVTEGKVGPNAVSTGKLQDASVTAAKLAAGAVPATVPDTLPSGKSLKGTLASGIHIVNGTDEPGLLSISFGIPLASPPNLEIHYPATSPTANCSGNVGDPTAAPGYLCVYLQDASPGGSSLIQVLIGNGYRRFGEVLQPTGVGTNTNVVFDGTWAVTAP